MILLAHLLVAIVWIMAAIWGAAKDASTEHTIEIYKGSELVKSETITH